MSSIEEVAGLIFSVSSLLGTRMNNATLVMEPRADINPSRAPHKDRGGGGAGTGFRCASTYGNNCPPSPPYTCPPTYSARGYSALCTSYPPSDSQMTTSPLDMGERFSPQQGPLFIRPPPLVECQLWAWWGDYSSSLSLD